MGSGKIKVLHILNSLLPSGAETMLCSSAGYWNPLYEKHILATAEDFGHYAPELKKAGYILHHIYNKNYFLQHRAVRKFFSDEKFDIVHIHRQAEALSYACDAKLAGSKRIIRTVHNVFVFSGPVQIRERAARHMACLIGVRHVSIGPSVTRNEKRRFGIDTVEISNWYDENRFFYTTRELKANARESLGISQETYCILTVGNCTAVKNHMAVLKAVAAHKDDSLKNILYLHVGLGPQEEEEKEYVKDHNIQGRVRFSGFCDPVLYLRAADLYVMPSLYEGFGISALEALATGVRCIFTDVPGLEDFKEFDFDNLEFCNVDAAAIEQTVIDNVKRGRKENSMAQAVKVRGLYGIECGVRKYEAVYKGMAPSGISWGV